MIELIVINSGKFQKIQYALKTARIFNPEIKINFLTDSDFHIKGDWDIFDLREFSKRSDKLDDIYEHKNTMPKYFNLPSIKRWFQLKKFVHSMNINNFFFIDRDVLVFCDLIEWGEKFSQYDFTVSNKIAMGQSFWNKTDILEDYINLVEHVYNNKESGLAKKIFSCYDRLQENHLSGGVCDMVFWENLFSRFNYNYLDINKIIDNSFFDHNIEIINGFDCKNGMKNIYFKDGIPYSFKEREIRLNTIHCTASGKARVEEFYNEARNKK